LRLLELQDTLAFYKTAPVQDLLKDATVKFDKKDISEIEKCAFDKVRHYGSMEDEEKQFFKGKVKKSVLFNVGLMGIYKVLMNASVFGIS